MTSKAFTATSDRRLLQGVATIVRFNWPMYVVGTAMGCGAILIALYAPWPTSVRFAIGASAALGLFWVCTSLLISFWIYDVSPLNGWAWIADALPGPPMNWVNIHCGFDESTPILRSLFPDSTGRALDIFDEKQMTEPSIQRARQIGVRQCPGAPADYRRLPVNDTAMDAAFLLLSAHELRSPAAREQLFRELHRILRPGGHAIVAEHLRDAANFIAFGPGFMHFHSRATWRRTFRDGGLTLERAFRVTPFIAVFVLRRPA